MAAARSGKVPAVKLLLDAGADVNAKETWGGQSALMWAAAQQQPAMVKFLIAHGANVNARGAVRDWQRKVIREPRPKDMNQGGFTPLLYAAREGCIECARELVKGGADLDLPDPHRVTPLVMALFNLHFDLASYLIDAGADVNKWDLYGRTPLYMAADVSTLPVQGNGSMVVLPSMDKLTAVDVAKQLIAKGADVNIQLKRRPPYRNVPQDRGGDTILSFGATPLLRAARAGDAPMVELLLKNGALVDLAEPIAGDATLKIVTREDPEALELIRHDCAHVLAEAVQELFPGTQVTIGPVIENGFYYDFFRNEPFTPEDLEKIEKKMREKAHAERIARMVEDIEERALHRARVDEGSISAATLRSWSDPFTGYV